MGTQIATWIAFIICACPLLPAQEGSRPSTSDEPSSPEISGSVFGAFDNIYVDGNAFAALSIAAPFGTGLETHRSNEMTLLVTDPGEALTNIGVSQERIRTRTELRLRTAKLTPLPEDQSRREGLIVSLLGVGNAFHIEVSFMRPTNFLLVREGRVPTVSAMQRQSIVYQQSMIGTHGDTAAYVIDSLDEVLDTFLNEYLAANGL